MTKMQAVLLSLLLWLVPHSFVSVNAFSSSAGQPSISKPPESDTLGNVLILDHLNINHEQGRHDWLKAFYFDFLKCTVDPRKAENLKKGSKTLWANMGAHQFHLPQGKPQAQLLQGRVTLQYPDLSGLQSRLSLAQDALQGSKFHVVSQHDNDEHSMTVLDPWGNEFVLKADSTFARDERGVQPRGEDSEGLGMSDLTIHVPQNCNIAGIGRFYNQVLGAPTLDLSQDACVVSVGPQQTLTFVSVSMDDTTTIQHDDLREEQHEVPDGKPAFVSNYGPHVSMYVADLASSYRRAEELGVLYVNPRFKRRAYSLDQALDQCMFRCIDIVDPEQVEAGPIVKLEHEIRSVVKPDGSKYKSCPFDEIPKSCVVG